ncbi:cytochrome C552, partial [Lacticaseibacillus rhamnosus]
FKFGRSSQATIRQAASSMSANVLKGETIKNEAMAENYVPFIGSSELSRMDAFHPSVLAQKYHRDYRPFLMGMAGTQSLTHFLSINALTHVEGKKAVMVLSPQWFVPGGVRKAQFDYFYSPAQMTTFLLHANPNSEADRFAARRLLQFPSTDSDRTVNEALKNIAAGQKLSDGQYWYLKQVKDPMADHQDALFSRLFLNNNQPQLDKAAKTLPSTYDVDDLDGLATRMGMQETTNNPFELKNDFYTKRVKRNMPKLKGSQATWSYVKSPEYSDLQLVLNTFAKKHMEVLFVIPPINAKWAAFTGLDLGMIQNTVTKMKYQLQTQGFNHVLDLSQDGAQPYFMEDTIHIGWRGWLKMDQTVRPFLKTTKAAPVHYKLNDQFYTKHWQQQSANGLD